MRRKLKFSKSSEKYHRRFFLMVWKDSLGVGLTVIILLPLLVALGWGIVSGIQWYRDEYLGRSIAAPNAPKLLTGTVTLLDARGKTAKTFTAETSHRPVRLTRTGKLRVAQTAKVTIEGPGGETITLDQNSEFTLDQNGCLSLTSGRMVVTASAGRAIDVYSRNMTGRLEPGSKVDIHETGDRANALVVTGKAILYDRNQPRELLMTGGEIAEFGPASQRWGIRPDPDLCPEIGDLDHGVVDVQAFDADTRMRIKPLSPLMDGYVFNFPKRSVRHIILKARFNATPARVDYRLLSLTSERIYTGELRPGFAVRFWIDARGIKKELKDLPQDYYLLHVIPWFQRKDGSQVRMLMGTWLKLRLKVIPGQE
ncbi:MAG: hypothetical protein D6820_12610 [Lentisphaerae bacterium]|nr:MAG: hypothetical protein D6820_12610 [Lentisphaerota bacterium]